MTITQNADYIIKKAYRHASLITLGTTPTTVQYSEGLDSLNDIINLWGTQGLKLWLQQDIAIPLTAGKMTYTMGPTGDVVMDKPLQILQGYYLGQTLYRQPLVPLSRDEWTRLAQVGVLGALNSYFVDKQSTQFSVSFYNTPDATAATGVAHLVTRVAPTNPSVTTATTGFPPEWYLALQWALAEELADSQPPEVQDRCAKHSAAYRQALEAFDVEDAATQFQPDPRSIYYGSNFR